MDDSLWPDATRQELRINSDVCARIHDDGAPKQNLLQQLTLHAIGVRFVNTICEAIGRKRVFVRFVSDPTKTRSSLHQRRVIISVKKEAHSHGK